MLSRIRWRIAIPITAAIWIFTLIASFNLSSQSRSSSLDRLEDSSHKQLLILQEMVRGINLPDAPQEQLIEFTNLWADRLEINLTLISKDGIVLADSEKGSEINSNQLIRIEIRDAINQGYGTAVRFDINDREYFFAAAPIQEGNTIQGFIRLKQSLDPINQTAAAIRNRTLLFGSLLSLIVFGISLVISSRIVTPLIRLTRTTQRIKTDDIKAVPLPQGQDEIGILTQAIHNMERKFIHQIQDLRSESITFRAVLDQMTDGVVMVNPQGEISLMNPAAESIFNTTSEQSIGRSVAEVLRQHQWIELWRTSTADGQEKTTSLEIPSQHTFLQGISIPLKEILPGFTLLLFQDLSQLRRLETTRQDFISNISHELRTPLASLKALTETLQDGALEDPPAAKRFLSRIDTEVDALTQMVAELLELSRIESGQVPLDLDPVSPGLLLTKAVERMREQAERRRIEVNVDAAPDLVRVKADFRRVEQVLVNLLHNAIKFSPKNRRINLRAYQDGERVIFSVEDQGPGIPETDLERIFERFYKADQARTGGGTGLGLSISKHLVEAHQGEIWAESRLNHGSKFYFSLPIADQD